MKVVTTYSNNVPIPTYCTTFPRKPARLEISPTEMAPHLRSLNSQSSQFFEETQRMAIEECTAMISSFASSSPSLQSPFRGVQFLGEIPRADNERESHPETETPAR